MWKWRPEAHDANFIAQIRILVYKTELQQDLRVIKDNTVAICTMSGSSKKVKFWHVNVSRSEMCETEFKHISSSNINSFGIL